ncbi:hypothetical protein OIV83_004320 [Microbotryomycetes sp. JL201]|nr:hypothetical protein OIV83_004306 [Microbotryomycetes sp. JL201]KAK4049173.1 hypothetical protein OIV83_004320 [Microbotryomycetes sp. JL201]
MQALFNSLARPVRWSSACRAVSSAAATGTSATTRSAPIAALPPQRPQKHKAKKSKAKMPAPATPALARGPQGDAHALMSLMPTLGLGRQQSSRPPDGQAVALTSAENYDTAALLKSLDALGLLGEGGAVNLLGEAIYLPQWRPQSSADAAPEGEVFVFESGTIVTWGLAAGGAESFLREVIRGTPPTTATTQELGWVEQGRYNEVEKEALDFYISRRSTGMQGDTIHLSANGSLPSDMASVESSIASPDLLARLAFSAGMARVTKLAIYEEQFDAFAEGIAGIPKLLESGSESPVKKTDIIKRVGTLHGFRQKLNLEDENLLEEPEFLWEDAELHGHYAAVSRALEFNTRLRTLNDRVDYAFQLQSTLLELLNTKTSHFLEWIIILLIAFEISIVLLREGLALWNDDEDSQTSNKKKKSAH